MDWRNNMGGIILPFNYKNDLNKDCGEVIMRAVAPSKRRDATGISDLGDVLIHVRLMWSS